MLQILSASGYRSLLEVVPTKPTVRMHRALIVWPDGVERDSHVKLICPPPGMPDRQLVNEGIAWLLALTCRLPVPPHAGYMILPPLVVTQAHPDVVCPPGGAVAWVCSTEPHRGLRVDLDGEMPRLIGELCLWQHLPGALALDEWIANVDRHTGNLIRRGPADFVLIDHDYALSGPHWLADLLHEGRADDFRNRLYDLIETELGRSSDACKDLRSDMVPPAEAFAGHLSEQADHLSEWLPKLLEFAEDQWSLAGFLAYRAAKMPVVIKRRYRLLT